jgi:hypothetical protein
VRGVNGRQVISPQAHEGRGEGTAGALCRPKSEGDGAMQAWIDRLPDGKLPTLAASMSS